MTASPDILLGYVPLVSLQLGSYLQLQSISTVPDLKACLRQSTQCHACLPEGGKLYCVQMFHLATVAVHQDQRL